MNTTTSTKCRILSAYNNGVIISTKSPEKGDSVIFSHGVKKVSHVEDGTVFLEGSDKTGTFVLMKAVRR